MSLVSVGIAALAGVLSTLSPCVLPLVPMVLAAAVGEHRHGPVVLAAGLAVSFVAVGLFIATIGYAFGLEAGYFRVIGGFLLVAIGFILLMPALQMRFAVVASPISSWTDNRFGGLATTGMRGQFALGLLLGIVWTPCVGPTLGAASMLASRGENLGKVSLAMTAFGIGAAMPLLVLGLLSREAIMVWRGRLLSAGKAGKMALGGLLLTLGLMIVSGLDKRIETLLVDLSPGWLTDLTTRF